MSMTAAHPAAGPLLRALRDLTLAYDEALGRSEALIGALVSGDFARVQTAVTAQVAALAVVDGAEERRRAATAALARELAQGPTTAVAWRRATGAGGESLEAITSSALLELLGPADAAELRRVRHELLHKLVTLQSLNRHAARLLRGAQAALNRAMAATAPQAAGYGPRGEQTRPQHLSQPQHARWA